MPKPKAEILTIPIKRRKSKWVSAWVCSDGDGVVIVLRGWRHDIWYGDGKRGISRWRWESTVQVVPKMYLDMAAASQVLPGPGECCRARVEIIED